MLKRIEKLYLARTNSASFYATDGVRVFLKYGLVVSSTLSALCTKGLRYDVLGKEVMGVSSYFYFVDSLSDPPPPLE